MKKSLFTFLVILILSLIKTPTLQGQSCSARLAHDSLELVKLYKATNGYHWKSKWDLSQPISTWHGVTLADDGCSVKRISLNSNGLSGRVPNLNLSKLEWLQLNDNQLNGSVPNFDNMPKLEDLYFYGNQLSGSIPDFDHLLNLKNLSLAHNQLSEPIPDFDHLSKLERLYLDDNQLSGSIPDFNLPNLWRLYLSKNQLTFQGIESNLNIRDFKYSPQNYIPIYTSEGYKLYIRAGGGVQNNTYTWYKDDAKYKTIKGDSVLIATEPGSYYCKVTNSAFTRPQDEDQNLVLQSDKIAAVNLDYLELVKLYNSTNGANWKNKWDLSQPISTWHGVTLADDGYSVKSISLNSNGLSGRVPNLNLPKLEWLQLNDNQLNGTIPNFDNMPKLEDLYFYGNQLSGSIPDFDHLLNLKNLSLAHNQLSEPIPDFDHLSKLERLYLDDNQLSGSIPDFNLPNLWRLYLSKNQLTFQGIESNLNISDFSYSPQNPISIYKGEGNKLYVKAGGRIENNTYFWYKNDSEYKTIKGDSALVVTESGNYYCKVTNSAFTRPQDEDQNLVLQSDKIAAVNLDYLELVKLYNSTNGANWKNKWDLSQPISTWHGVTLADDGYSVKSISLNSNGLSGRVPNLNLPKLEWLQLNDNQLNGTIPNFDHLPNLRSLNLSDNQLSGSIPNFDLPHLWQLYLSKNQLTFQGIESNLNISDFSYSPQNPISIYKGEGNKLYVKAGGRIENNTYFWYKNDSEYKTIKGDSALVVTESGNYYCKVTNSAFTRPQDEDQNLVLQSDKIAAVNLDYLELVKLYNLTNGANWKNKWDLSQPISTWHGVTLADDGYSVKSISLNSNGLSGRVPNLNLPKLEWLQLNDNQLNGTIPNFDHLPNLRSLNLSDNQLSGSIPNFDLPKLGDLHLHDNKLSGSIPDFDLPHLWRLYLYDNQLSGSIPNFDLPGLVWLYLYSNQLSGTIPNFNLPNLYSLALSYNELSGSIPNFNLPKLEKLYLQDNQLSGSIPNFDLPKLGELKLENNQLSGSIPDFDLPHLWRLYLYKNQLTFQGIASNLNISDFHYSPQNPIPIYKSEGYKLYVKAGGGVQNNTYTWYKDDAKYKTIVGDSLLITTEPGYYYCKVTNRVVKGLVLQSEEIAAVNRIDYLELVKLYNSTNGANWKNKWDLSKPISTWHGITFAADGYSVKSISLNSNGLSGRIPNLNLPKLERLDLNNNQLSGSIPNFDHSPNLEWLDLNVNQLSGTIPNFNLPYLKYLPLSNNQLSGSIPNFDHLPKLERLDLNNNQLSGSIPNFDLPNLYWLNLDNNKKLSGSIPNFDLPKLEYLNLSHNQLSGSIPNFDFPNLWGLSLAYSQLSGPIPNFDHLPKLRVLSLGLNQLSGTIPDFDHLPNLIYLYLGYNQLSGAVPNFDFPNLGELNLSNNQLSESIPNFDLPKLWLLHLDNNQLSGGIPDFYLDNLKELHLDNNQLSGTIPHFDLPNLQKLDLDNNQLSGSIPNFYLPKLEWLDLDNNQLSGSIPNLNLPKLKDIYLNNNQLSGGISSFDHSPSLEYLDVTNNYFTFKGIEFDLNDINRYISFNPQHLIPIHVSKEHILSVKAGSGLENNTYTWYRDDKKYKTIVGDSALIITVPGNYYCKILNRTFSQGDYDNEFVLQSNTIFAVISYVDAKRLAKGISPEESRIVLFPNPAKGSVSIDAKGVKRKRVDIQVFDQLGDLRLKRSIKQSTNTKISLDVSSLSHGNYYVQIKVGGKVVVTKPLIISH